MSHIMPDLNTLYQQAVELLQKLIATQSFSKEEEGAADIIEQFLKEKGITPTRKINNVWARNKHFDEAKPTILLNSHHDTVKPNSGYTRDPFDAKIEDGKLYGLGSNDAGGCLVSLIATFLYFYERDNLKYNSVKTAGSGVRLRVLDANADRTQYVVQVDKK